MQIEEKYFREIGYWSKVIVVGVVFGVGIQFASATWTERPTNPPAANISGPLTTGEGDQTKAKGSIGLAGGGSLLAGGFVAAPFICIGVDCRGAWPVETDTLASVVARGNNAGTGGIYAGWYADSDDGNYYMDPKGTTQLSYLNANYRIDTPYIYDSNDYNYYMDLNNWTHLNRLWVTGDTAFPWPDDNDDAATKQYVDAQDYGQRFFGTFQTYSCDGSCRRPNPYTGACSCPAGGWWPSIMTEFDSRHADGCGNYDFFEDKGMTLYVCVK